MSENNNIGTKNYWEDVYKTELQNFEDFGDNGDIWFGKLNQRKIVDWLCANNIQKNFPILDIGCGNGMLLADLALQGYQDLTGIDYVQDAIELAQKVLKEKDLAANLEAADFLSDHVSLPINSYLRRQYHIVIDKGTYDAIGMCPINGSGKREKYKEQLDRILESSGLFIIVSCNWTKEELIQHFTSFNMVTEIPTPTFTFGGRTGHTVTSIVFKKC